MEGKDIAGLLIGLFCIWGCAALFYGIGLWARRRKTPMHFWFGTKIDPATISDILAYNRENGRMWKCYSIVYWISGVCMVLDFWNPAFAIAGVVLLFIGCTLGLWWLVREYKRIFAKYSVS